MAKITNSQMTASQIKMRAEAKAHREVLIEDNKNAPADTVIRAIFENGCTEIHDHEDGVKFETVEECLHFWYDVDEMYLVFTLPNGIKSWIRFIHNDRSDKPHVENIADYHTNLDNLHSAAFLKPMLKDDYYNGVYRA